MKVPNVETLIFRYQHQSSMYRDMSLTAGQTSLGGWPSALISSSLQCHERNLINRVARRRAIPGAPPSGECQAAAADSTRKGASDSDCRESGQTGTVEKSYSEVAESDCDHHVGRLTAFVAAMVYHISAG